MESDCRYWLWILIFFGSSMVVRAQTTGDYRSKGTAGGVPWETASNWETWNGSAWVVASAAPTSADGVITILNGHKMNMSSSRTVDQVVIAAGGTVTMDINFIFSQTYTLNNGPGTDLDISGTLNITGISTLTGAATVQVNSGGVLNFNANSILQSVLLTNNGSFNLNDGTLNLNNGVSFVNNGLVTLVQNLLSSTSITSNTSATFTNSATGVIYRTNGSGGAVNFSNTITFSNSGLIKGFNEYQWAVSPALNNGIIEPGNSSITTLTLTSNSVISQTPTFNFEISGTGSVAGTDNDYIVFSTANPNMSGSTLKLVDNSGSTANTTYTLFRTNSGVLTGPFASFNIPPNFSAPFFGGINVTITRLAERHWIATSPQNWNNPAFWSTTAGGTGNAGVPTNAHAVYFDAVANGNCTLMPSSVAASVIVASGYTGTIIQGSNTLAVGNQFVMAGGTFSGGSASITVGSSFTFSGTSFVSTTGALTIGGDMTLNGPFTAGAGTVIFNGSAPQRIGGSQVVNFNNINDSNTSAGGLMIQSNQNLKGSLTLITNAVFDADGSNNNSVFKLLSTADSPVQDAAIAILPSGSQVTGSITIQRYMSLEGVNSSLYRYISVPVSNGTVADIQNEIPVTGSFTGASTCTGCSTNPSLFYYNESVITDNNGDGLSNIEDGYIGFPSASNTEIFQTARGYALYVRGNLLSSALWDIRGTLNQGNTTAITFPITYTNSGTAANDGWNLVGNPYASAIDWNASPGWTKTNIGASTYIRDNGQAGVYATWNGSVGTNGGSRYIAMGQGFWVKATAGGASLQANENVKTALQSTSFIRQQSLSNHLRVTLRQNTLQDEAVIHFRPDATSAFDDHADAIKLQNRSFDLSTLSSDGDRLAINSWSPLRTRTIVPLSMDKVDQGMYELVFSERNSFNDSLAISLIDRFHQDTLMIDSDKIHSFSVTSGIESQRSDRFILIFELKRDIITSVKESSQRLVVYPNPSTGIFYIRMQRNNLISTAEVVSVMGLKIGDIQLSDHDSFLEGAINLQDQPAGVYFIKIFSGGKSQTIKIIKN